LRVDRSEPVVEVIRKCACAERASIQDQLRRIDQAAPVARRDIMLPLAEARLRESICPSQVIPLVHVK
jgi:hypothetical protein